MELLPLIVQATALVLTGLLILFAPSFIAQRIKRSLQPMLASVPELVLQLRTVQARAAGTIRTAERRRVLAPVEDDDDDLEEGDGDEPEIPAALLGLASQLGIDPGKVMAGDPAELAKVKTALASFKAPTAAPQQAAYL